MPITLGCPSCGKRFRARDESAGKKVKCPYCQAAVPVPTAEESATAGAPTAPLPPAAFDPPPSAPPSRAPSPPPRPTSPPPAPVVASPDDWGALPAPTAPVPTAPSRPFTSPPPEPAPEPEPEPNPFPSASPRERGRDRERGDKPRPKAAKPESKSGTDKGKTAEKTPEEVLAGKWAAVRRGLFWVQFALLFVALLGFVGFGLAVYARSVGELPTEKDVGLIKIEGYINSEGEKAIPLSKKDELYLLVYGVPVCAAFFLLTIGRFFSGRGPRNSGARGLLVLSGLLTLAAFVALLASAVCWKMDFRDELRTSLLTLVICGPLAEFWFLIGLTASGLALKRPGVARAAGFAGFAGFVGFVIAALVLVQVPVWQSVGWNQYELHSDRPREKAPPRPVPVFPAPKDGAKGGAKGAPKDPVPAPKEVVTPPVAAPAPKETDPALVERRMYEQAAVMLGWLILVGAYWRAVRGVRSGAFDYIAAVEDAKANAEAERKEK